jgi:EAL domain-containing protein (putative c-di-GMP-specific phosphodiesterase class I)
VESLLSRFGERLNDSAGRADGRVVGTSDDNRAVAPGRGPGRQTLGFGGALGRIGARFDNEGALGLLLLDASSFSEIERLYGFEAHRQSMKRLATLVEEITLLRFDAENVSLVEELGRNEIILAVFRPLSDVGFYMEEVPALRKAISEGIARQGTRVAYPYAKKAPPVHAGMAVALRNPTLGVETQIWGAVDEAREDARLDLQIATRARRKRFIELVLKGQVYCLYEPIVEVATKTVHGYEALARGPDGSEFHFPMDMFEAAEQEGFLFQLDCLCRSKAFEGAIGRPEGTKLFLNIRPTSILDPSFRADVLSRTLEEGGLRPSDLVLEISERESIDNFTIFREVRDYYGKLGFQFALDDTGAGYASLQAVMELSPEYIKVDRALVHGIDEDPGRQELLRALHTVAGQIRARIVAEGLDTLEELSTLADLSIPFGQGWIFGKPAHLGSRR